MNDGKSRALLATALHPSSTPNERLMALAALNRMMERAGLHPGDIAILPRAVPADDDHRRQMAWRDDEIASLAHRLKVQDAALRKAGREVAALERTIAELTATIARKEAAAGDDACQIAALEADLAARDRVIAMLHTYSPED